MTGAGVGALCVDTGLTARVTTQSPAFIHILTDLATAFQLKASLTSTYLTEVGKHEDFLKTRYTVNKKKDLSFDIKSTRRYAPCQQLKLFFEPTSF